MVLETNNFQIMRVDWIVSKQNICSLVEVVLLINAFPCFFHLQNTPHDSILFMDEELRAEL